jgi:hypothetical protein
VTRPGSAARSYRGRFRVAYLLLALVVGAAGGAFAVLLNQPGPTSPESELAANWSSWRPAGDDPSMVNQIAEFVARHYRRPDGKELVAVKGTIPPTLPINGQLIPIVDFAVSSQTNGQTNYSIVPADQGVIYQLCGLGAACSIDTGKGSVERERLLRRESLELALYTFRYVQSVDSVVAFLPPLPGRTPQWAFLFLRSELEPELRRPLGATLPTGVAPTVKSIDPIEARTIDGLTDPWRFHFHYTQLQDQSLVLALDPSGVSGQ